MSLSRRNAGQADQLKVAARIGVQPRTFQRYLDERHKPECPYPVQFALEVLANIKDAPSNGDKRAQLVVTDCKGDYPSIHGVARHVIEGTKKKFQPLD